MNIGETKTVNFETTDTNWDFNSAAAIVFIIHVNRKEYVRYERGAGGENDITIDGSDPKKASVFLTRSQSLALTTGMMGIEIYVQKNADEHGSTLFFEVEKINRPFSTNI
jgi:hypothetical protein